MEKEIESVSLQTHTKDDLKQLQALPLDVKIKKTELRLREWVDTFGEDGVYVSFSGGKDSTVLLDIVRKDYPNVVGVFVDTGLEYPEIREFVKTFDNIEWLKPKKTFKQVINEYGYPMISKEVSSIVKGARTYLRQIAEREKNRINNCEDTIVKGAYGLADMVGITRRGNATYDEYDLLRQGILIKQLADEQGIDLREICEKGSYIRTKQLFGEWLNKDGVTPSQFNQQKYMFFLDAPFEISNRCCDIMKKNPIHSFERKHEKLAITAQMASESRLRTTQWMQHGCNMFNIKNPKSNPMSFWTENDVLQYIVENDLEICSVYGDIVKDGDKYKTTGCNRTGCMFCGFGCHLEKPGEGRFLKMKETHPKQYDYIMRPKEEGGLGYKEVIDWMNEKGGFHIEY